MTPIQIVCAMLVQLLWGYLYVAIKIGVAEFPPLFFLALRFVAIAVLLIPFVPRPTRREIGPIIPISVFFGGLNFGLFYIGLGLGTGTMTAVAYQLTSPFIILLAWPMLEDRPSRRTTFGVVLAFGGVVVAAAGTHGSTNVIAALLVACAALAFAVGNVLTKRYGPFAPLTLMAWMSLFTVPQVMLVSWILEHGQLASLATADVRGWTMLTYTVVLSGIAGFGLWFWLIARCSIGRLAPFCLLQPVFAAASSVLFLGERLTAPLVVGGLISLVGVAVTQLKPEARPGASRMQARLMNSRYKLRKRSSTFRPFASCCVESQPGKTFHPPCQHQSATVTLFPNSNDSTAAQASCRARRPARACTGG
jgi:O-acetylserine/cysteine efflux transporter